MIAGLLLAAGRSRRFGADKLCAKLDGKAVIRWSMAALSPLDSVYVVIAPGADAVTQALSRLDVRFVVNLGRDEGMASSIRAGIAALPADVAAVVIALGDQPRGSPAVTRALVDRWHAGDVAAVVPSYLDGRGHPVLFGRACFPALLALRGDVGARGVLEELGERAATVEVPAAMPVDVDTPEALAVLQEPRRDS
ncbi:MAG: nucleotidyltransferase family protein [Polaromonas sp.]|nr:nucleotidyltransferase family protein [Gemmatimonadaceae bacterium]